MVTPEASAPGPKTAFVLGGGGMLGASEVGMLQALVEAGIQPDLVLGCSVGAINGAMIAAEPTSAGTTRLRELWGEIGSSEVFSGGVLQRAKTLARSKTALHDHSGLEGLLEEHAEGRKIEDLHVPYQCVAACIETASARWFDAGPLVPAVLASCSVPGLLPPVEIEGKHYLDGGLVHSIPVGRAVQLGAERIYVLHVGRIETELSAPRWPWEVGVVAFEIARRHRFFEEMANIPETIEVVVMQSGFHPRKLENLRYRDRSTVPQRIDAAYEASSAQLRELSGQ